MRSCAYGFTVRRNVALRVPAESLGSGDRVRVDVFGELVPAEVADDVLFDPDGKTDARLMETPTIEQVVERAPNVRWQSRPRSPSSRAA